MVSVLLTADAVGGVWTYALDLARGLADRGIAPIVAVLGPSPSAEQTAEAAGIAGLRLVDTALPLDWTAENASDIRDAGRSLADLAADLGTDLVHLNSPALAADGSFPCPLVIACHSCVATWWTAVRGSELPADFRWRTELVRAGYRAAECLIAPSAAFANATAAAYGLRVVPRVIHNGTSRTFARDQPPTGGSGAPDPFVLTAGRLWDEGKGVAVLDAAAARLPVPVLAAGATAGPNGASIRLEAVQPIGSVTRPELDALMDRRPIFASLALYEPFGLAVLEAATAACPLVLSDIPSFRELWDGAARFVPARDPAASAEALRALADDPGGRTRLGMAASDRARRYRSDSMAASTAALYGEVLQAGARRAGGRGHSVPVRAAS